MLVATARVDGERRTISNDSLHVRCANNGIIFDDIEVAVNGTLGVLSDTVFRLSELSGSVPVHHLPARTSARSETTVLTGLE